jgi:hypothetical protein
MSKDGNGPSGNKEEEQGNLLTKVVYLAPLFAVILQLLELALKLLGVIR